MKTRLLVRSVDDSSFVLLLRVESRVDLNLETICKLVLEFERRAEDVGGGPGLSESDAFLVVGPLGLQVPMNVARLGVLRSTGFEDHAGGRLGLDLERVARVVEVLAEQVVGGLAKVLE